MLKIDRSNKQMSRLKDLSLPESGFQELGDLQQLIFNSPEEFFAEINEELFIVGQEIKPSTVVKDRIDILAFDREGNSVIIELKRGNNKWQLAQSLSYAAMISEWDPEQFRKELGLRGGDLDEWIDDPSKINVSQRIILIAEDYDYEVLITAKWLSEVHAVQISCCQISLALDKDGGREYLSCVKVYPPEALESIAIQRGIARVAAAGQVRTIEERLKDCENSDEQEFFSKRLGQRRNSKRDALAFPSTGTIRWYVEVHPKHASVYQAGRFEGDESFWKKQLSDPNTLLARQRGVRFHLMSSKDFENLQKVVEQSGGAFKWIKGQPFESEKDSEPKPEPITENG